MDRIVVSDMVLLNTFQKPYHLFKKRMFRLNDQNQIVLYWVELIEHHVELDNRALSRKKQETLCHPKSIICGNHQAGI